MPTCTIQNVAPVEPTSTYTATSSTERPEAKIIITSKLHQSKQRTPIEGIPIFRYSKRPSILKEDLEGINHAY
jgi:hypothetical protein